MRKGIFQGFFFMEAGQGRTQKFFEVVEGSNFFYMDEKILGGGSFGIFFLKNPHQNEEIFQSVKGFVPLNTPLPNMPLKQAH